MGRVGEVEGDVVVVEVRGEVGNDVGEDGIFREGEGSDVVEEIRRGVGEDVIV